MAVETAAIPKRLVDDVTYLWVAETVLRKHKRPLSARELVNYGLEDGLFPATGLSQTPQKSMQARISLDILHNDQSRFVRTSRGRFLLREHLGEATRDELSFENSKLSVYTANRRVPTDPKEFQAEGNRGLASGRSFGPTRSNQGTQGKTGIPANIIGFSSAATRRLARFAPHLRAPHRGSIFSRRL